MAIITPIPLHAAFAPTERPTGAFTRFLDRLKAAQMRRADQIVSRYIDTHGGRLTDNLEREIERRFTDV